MLFPNLPVDTLCRGMLVWSAVPNVGYAQDANCEVDGRQVPQNSPYYDFCFRSFYYTSNSIFNGVHLKISLAKDLCNPGDIKCGTSSSRIGSPSTPVLQRRLLPIRCIDIADKVVNTSPKRYMYAPNWIFCLYQLYTLNPGQCVVRQENLE